MKIIDFTLDIDMGSMPRLALVSKVFHTHTYNTYPTILRGQLERDCTRYASELIDNLIVKGRLDIMGLPRYGEIMTKIIVKGQPDSARICSDTLPLRINIYFQAVIDYIYIGVATRHALLTLHSRDKGRTFNVLPCCGLWPVTDREGSKASPSVDGAVIIELIKRIFPELNGRIVDT